MPAPAQTNISATQPQPQQGGVYLFINPGDSGVTERMKSARSRSSSRRITWDGLHQGGVSQEGGGSEGDGREESHDGGGSGHTEVVVEKLG